MARGSCLASLALAVLPLLCLASPAQAGADAAGETFLIRADELLTLSTNSRGVVVDVRDGEEFRRVRIPGSLNIPIHALKTKGFLKPRDVVLVNAGFERSVLLEACRDLRRAGFSSVRLLEGGLAHWAALGGPILGDRTALASVRLVSPRSLHQEKDREALLLFDVAPSPKESDTVLCGAVAIPLGGGSQAFPRALAEAASAREGRLVTAVLVDGDGSGYSTLPGNLFQALAVAGRPVSAFWLEGGRAGYQRFLREQAAMRDRREEKVPDGCAACP